MPGNTQPAPTPQDAARREAEHFDRHIQEHGDFNPFAPRGWKTLEKRFARWARPRASAVLLDVGCGSGNSRQIYRGHVRGYVGVDLSRQAVAAARRRFPGDTWEVADACRLPFADGSFDVVAFSSVLHHIEDFTPAVREARRVLKPGGLAFAFDPNLLHPMMALLRWPRSPLYLAEGVSPNESPLLPGTIRRAFIDAGLVQLRQRCVADIPYRQVAPRLIQMGLTFYNAADWAMARTGLGRWFGPFTVTAGRNPPHA